MKPIEKSGNGANPWKIGDHFYHKTTNSVSKDLMLLIRSLLWFALLLGIGSILCLGTQFIQQPNGPDNHQRDREDSQHSFSHNGKCFLERFKIHNILRSAAGAYLKVDFDYLTKVRIKPPAMTEAICPDTLTPMECMSKKF